MPSQLVQSRSLQQTQTVQQYFKNFNQGDFLTTSQLFSEAGQLLPPFEEPIVGPNAIHAYLKREAAGMEAIPQETSTQVLAEGQQQVTVRGRVKAMVFVVNVAWVFDLDKQGNIRQVEVKLLASLQELFTIRQS